MKSYGKTLFALLAVVMCFAAVQPVWASKGLECTTLVEGTVAEILYDDNAIIVDGSTVYGVPVDEWELPIEVGDSVVINAHVCPETGKLVACYLTVDGTLIDLRPRSSR